MTLCVGTLCDDRKTIVLVADRMFGIGGWAEAELNIRKATAIHKDWMVMIAGNDVAPAVDIIDDLRSRLKVGSSWSVCAVIEQTVEACKCKRMKDAETKYLSSRGWTMEKFRTEGLALLGQSSYDELDLRLQNAELSITMLVAGFDEDGIGHLFSVSDPGQHQRHDLNGFHAIGSGEFGAYYMMLWRELHVKMPLETMLYFSEEAKIFGEQAGGVGYKSDIYVMRHGCRTRKLTRGSVNALDSVWNLLRPKELVRKQRDQLAKLKEVKSLRAELRALRPKARKAKR